LYPQKSHKFFRVKLLQIRVKIHCVKLLVVTCDCVALTSKNVVWRFNAPDRGKKQANTGEEKQANTGEEKQASTEEEKQASTGKEKQANTGEEKQASTGKEKQANTGEEKQANTGG
jgi:hypothetical protein